jgi:hypothetical protein
VLALQGYKPAPCEWCIEPEQKEIAMKRASLGLCALGGVLLVLAGCSSLDLGFDLASSVVSAAGNVRMMDGSPDTVAVSLQDTLTKRGLTEVKVVKNADSTIVQGKTAAGLVCAFMLKSVRGTDGREQTHVSLQWIGNQDQGLNVQLLADVDRQPGVKK